MLARHHKDSVCFNAKLMSTDPRDTRAAAETLRALVRAAKSVCVCPRLAGAMKLSSLHFSAGGACRHAPRISHLFWKTAGATQIQQFWAGSGCTALARHCRPCFRHWPDGPRWRVVAFVALMGRQPVGHVATCNFTPHNTSVNLQKGIKPHILTRSHAFRAGVGALAQAFFVVLFWTIVVKNEACRKGDPENPGHAREREETGAQHWRLLSRTGWPMGTLKSH